MIGFSYFRLIMAILIGNIFIFSSPFTFYSVIILLLLLVIILDEILLILYKTDLHNLNNTGGNKHDKKTNKKIKTTEATS